MKKTTPQTTLKFNSKRIVGAVVVTDALNHEMLVIINPVGKFASAKTIELLGKYHILSIGPDTIKAKVDAIQNKKYNTYQEIKQAFLDTFPKV